MLWQLQLFLSGLEPVQCMNLAFALVCLSAMIGLPPRWVAGLSAALYVGLAFC